MTRRGRGLAVFLHSVRVGISDFRVVFTLRQWVIEWFLRTAAQIVMFSLIGRLVGSPSQTLFVLVGQATMVVVFKSVWANNSIAWERMGGTLPLLVSAPADLRLVLIGRGVPWILDGTFAAYVALVVLGPLFDLPMDVPTALALVPVLLVTGLVTYSSSMVLGAVSLWKPEARNLIGSIASLATMTFCGVNVDVEFFRGWIRALALCIPFTHGLRAVRAVVDNASFGVVGPHLLTAAGIAAAWLLVAMLVMDLTVERARRLGTIRLGG